MMLMVKRAILVIAVAAGALAWGGLAGTAQALDIDFATGQVTDWGVTPFPGTGSPGQVHAAWAPAGGYAYTTWWKEENNYSPIGYPVGHVPSPGGSLGERFDLEGLYYHKSGGNLQVLLVTSVGHVKNGTDVPGVATYPGGQKYYRLGDLFISTGAQGGNWDYAVATTNWVGYDPNTPLVSWLAYDVAAGTYQPFDHSDAPGTLYQINYDGGPIDPDAPNGSQVVAVVGSSRGGYGNSQYEEDLRPWVVDESNATEVVGAGAQLNAARFVYNSNLRPGGGYFLGTSDSLADETNTWFYEYTVPLSALGLTSAYDLSSLKLHIVNECGNDLLDSEGAYGPVLGDPPGHAPEPATVAGLLLGLGGLVRYARRRCRRGPKSGEFNGQNPGRRRFGGA